MSSVLSCSFQLCNLSLQLDEMSCVMICSGLQPKLRLWMLVETDLGSYPAFSNIPVATSMVQRSYVTSRVTLGLFHVRLLHLVRRLKDVPD